MKSLDASLLLRLVLADVPDQTAKVEELLADTSEKYAVADMAIAEMVWVLQGKSFGYDRARIASNIQGILDIDAINCNRAMFEVALPLYLKQAGISFIDACLATYAELNGAVPLLTFDKRLAKVLPESVTLL